MGYATNNHVLLPSDLWCVLPHGIQPSLWDHDPKKTEGYCKRKRSDDDVWIHTTWLRCMSLKTSMKVVNLARTAIIKDEHDS